MLCVHNKIRLEISAILEDRAIFRYRKDRINMNKKTHKKKKHPYATLAVLTLASATVINAVERVKGFVSDKVAMMKNMFSGKTEG